jgi:hypothetical protein
MCRGKERRRARAAALTLPLAAVILRGAGKQAELVADVSLGEEMKS